jgi:hypothetical protein
MPASSPARFWAVADGDNQANKKIIRQDDQFWTIFRIIGSLVSVVIVLACRDLGTHLLDCQTRVTLCMDLPVVIHLPGMKLFWVSLCLCVVVFNAISLGQSSAPQVTVLRPARVFDGETMHENWIAIVRGDKIERVGAAANISIPAGATPIELPGMTVLPGLIEAHSHVLLHPYSETSRNDQVAHEPVALRVARATNHLRNTLLAGFTTIRDLGTEGAGYSDVGLRDAVAQGIIPGPRMLVVTRAIVATGSYARRVMLPSGAFLKALRKPMASTA